MTGQYRRADDPWETDATLAETTALLANRLADYGARLWSTPMATAGQAVAQALGGARAVVCPPGLPISWLAPWRDLHRNGVVLTDGPDHPLTATELDQADAVVTSTSLAIALTGTLALQGGAGQGRRALSLIPDHHVCVLRQTDIVHGVPAAIAQLDHTRPITLVSGPSATADIEMERVQGVHGPRHLDVVLLTWPV
jgi:L-lactate dehydrogenase complex protein LldG